MSLGVLMLGLFKSLHEETMHNKEFEAISAIENSNEETAFEFAAAK